MDKARNTDRAFNNQLEMLRRKARALIEGPMRHPGTKVSVFVKRQGKLYTLQSPEGWPNQPSDIDGVSIVSSEQHMPSDDVPKPTPRCGAGMMAKNLREIFLGPGEIKVLDQGNNGRLPYKSLQSSVVRQSWLRPSLEHTETKDGLQDAPSNLPQSTGSKEKTLAATQTTTLLAPGELKEATGSDTPETTESQSPGSDVPFLLTPRASTESPSRSI